MTPGTFSFFPSFWVLLAIFFSFFGVFLLCERFFTVVSDFVIFVLVFLSVFFEGLVHMPRSTVNSMSALLDSSGPASSPSDDSALSTTQTPLLRHPLPHRPLRLQSRRILGLRRSPRLFSSRFPRCWQPFERTERQTLPPAACQAITARAPFTTNVPSIYTSTPTACRTSSFTGSVTVPSFPSTYSSVGIPVVHRASQLPISALSAPSLFVYSLVPSTSSPTLAPSVSKAFVVVSGYVPIPGKLVAKITSGAFVELADLLAENIRAQEAEPHTYLDGKLLVVPAKNGWRR